MITTHNRLDDLKLTLEKLAELKPGPDEILITVDGCSDGTEQWLRKHRPQARVFVNNPELGSVESRHNMLMASGSELVLSLDDDSYPEELDAIGRITNWMEANLAVAVLTFPQRSEEYPDSLTANELPELGYSGSYPNSGACYRRSVYNQLPGFNVHFFHAYEEPDYALQCIAAGHSVYHSNLIAIRHHYSPAGRNEVRTHQRHARNELWSAFVRAPWFFIPAIVPYRILRQGMFAARYGGVSWLVKEPLWWWAALRGLWRILPERSAVSAKAYFQWMRLLRSPQLGENLPNSSALNNRGHQSNSALGKS